FFDCEPTEQAILTARQQLGEIDLIRNFLRAANFDILFIDKGYPPQDLLLSDATVSDLAKCRVAPILRVELLMQRLITENTNLSAVVEALRAVLNEVRGQGYVALKSIVAYRTGLDIRSWTINQVEESFALARREVQEKGSIRLAQKPLLDTLLHVTFEEAARQELPIQFHTGYGDTDADMLLANPLNLRAVLEHREYRAMPVVLLHESYPYTQQGAYLATVYENVFFDLSYGIPFLGYHEMLQFSRAAFSVAPYSKLLYSSDAVGVPEIHWVSALFGRRILGQVLGECVANGELSPTEAEQAGAAVLHDNAIQLYKC
ncbi:MAG TPA: amidohydrolase family protein, partial [Ktedonobacteraceae bacterium]|nr:amidohydrolase family protein [Ktedonobacteraceae bacterium]